MQYKSVIFAIISVLTVAMSYGVSNTFYVFAAPPNHNFGGPNSDCENNPERLSATCCWTEANGQIWCQTCYVDTETGDFADCNEPEPIIPAKGRPNSGIIAPPPSGVAPSPEVDCTTNPTHPSCQPTELTPQVDCTQTPDDPLCETAIAPETAPTELTPQVDCTQTPDDPLCETATIPKGELEATEEPPTEEDQPSEESGSEGDNSNNDGN